MTLVTNPGAGNANSYGSVAEADTFNANRPVAGATWAALTTLQKEAAMIMAAIVIDAMPEAWTGVASSSTQALGWPRTGMYTRNGFAIPSGQIPIELKNAQSELARQLAAEDLLETSAIVAQGISSLKAGPVSLSFRTPETLGRQQTKREQKQDVQLAMVPDAVRLLLVPSWLKDVDEQDGDLGFYVDVL